MNWAALPDLRARLERLGIRISSTRVTVRQFPDSITYDSLDEAAAAVRRQGKPLYYDVFVAGERENESFRFVIQRDRNIHGEEIFIVSAEGLGDPESLTHLSEFLGLAPDETCSQRQQLKKTAFVAHRFDEHGMGCAERVARFLELLDFSVVTGRAYSPQPVSEKVRGRIIAQDLLFAILTPGEDATWLTQEPIVAEARDKPLFLLKQDSFDYKSGLLGDREYISFPREHIEVAFIPILEGLRELGYELGT